MGTRHPVKGTAHPVKGTAHPVEGTKGTAHPVKGTTSVSETTHGTKRVFRAKASQGTGNPRVDVERNGPVGASRGQLREKQVQADCFTPRKSLRQSPSPPAVEVGVVGWDVGVVWWC